MFVHKQQNHKWIESPSTTHRDRGQSIGPSFYSWPLIVHSIELAPWCIDLGHAWDIEVFKLEGGQVKLLQMCFMKQTPKYQNATILLGPEPAWFRQAQVTGRIVCSWFWGVWMNWPVPMLFVFGQLSSLKTSRFVPGWCCAHNNLDWNVVIIWLSQAERQAFSTSCSQAMCAISNTRLTKHSQQS